MLKYTGEEKLAAVKRHLEDGESLQHVAEIIGISEHTFRSWCIKYEIGGDSIAEEVFSLFTIETLKT